MVRNRKRTCAFCEKGRDDWEHYIEKCRITKKWFENLGEDRKKIVRRLWCEDLDIVYLDLDRFRYRKEGNIRCLHVF